MLLLKFCYQNVINSNDIIAENGRDRFFIAINKGKALILITNGRYQHQY